MTTTSIVLQILSAKWITISGCARKKGRRHEEHEKKEEVNAYFGYYSYYFNRIPSLEPRTSRRQRAPPGGPRSSRARTASAAGPRCAEKAPLGTAPAISGQLLLPHDENIGRRFSAFFSQICRTFPRTVIQFELSSTHCILIRFPLSGSNLRVDPDSVSFLYRLFELAPIRCFSFCIVGIYS